MATKLFKIGEYSYYGKWRVTVNNKKQTIQLDGIGYSDNKVMESTTYKFSEIKDFQNYTCEISTYYWSETMVDWVEANAKYDFWR